MRHALLVSGPVDWPFALAAAWVRADDEVVVVLLDGAVAASRASADTAAAIGDLLTAGVSVLAEDGALRRRGIAAAAIVDGVKVTGLDEVADLVADGSDRVVWL